MPKVKVSNSSGGVIGVIEMDCCPVYLCKYEITIYKGLDSTQAQIWRKIKKCVVNCHTCCSVECCGSMGKELEFEVADSFGAQKETLKKIHSGCYRECITGADNYELTLPSDNDEAALMIAAVQFLDMLYFEMPYGCAMWP